ncbi:hypothetical protein MKW92_044177 [Papaver armeniacum]|nr:hypothetical protein MKW92_044177 [Papaver armeniacum]
MSTAIGPLLHLPMQTWSAALFNFLLASQISMDDEGDKGNREEMRVMVCGKELSFGKKEFALISGLSFMKSNHNFSRPSTKSRLKMKHFPDEGNQRRTKKNRGNLAKRRRRKKNRVNVTNQATLILNVKLSKSHFGIKTRTIVKSNSALAYQIKADKPVGSEVTYKCQGMAHVLVVWGLEVLPKLRMCDDIMWHKEDAKHLVMLGLCEGPLVDDEQEDSLKNENVVEKEDLFEKGEEENIFQSQKMFLWMNRFQRRAAWMMKRTKKIC